MRIKHKKILLAVIISMLCLSAFAAQGGGSEAADEGRREKFEERIEALVDFYDIPGAAVVLIEGNESGWSGYYGSADLQKDIPVTEDTLFRAESITKSLTARLVLEMTEQGLISFDEPIEKYISRWEIPESKYDREGVTVRRLLNHSSGLTGGADYTHPGEEVYPLEEILAGEHGLHRAEPVREPGTDFEYSNQGFILLEMMIAEVTGRGFENYFREKILEPAGAEGYFTVDEDVKSRLATSYYADGEPVPHYVDNFKAAGGLLISAEDLASLIAAGSSPELYSSGVKADGFHGLGADISAKGHFIDRHERQEAVFHGGEGTGSLGMYYTFPEEGEGIVILTNSKGSWPFLFEGLGIWSEFKGLPQPEMTVKFSTITFGLNIMLAGLLVAGFIRLILLIRDIRRDKKQFDFRSVYSKKSLFYLLAAVLLILLWWFLGEVLVTNLLPVRYDRLGLGLAFFCLTLVFSSFTAGQG